MKSHRLTHNQGIARAIGYAGNMQKLADNIGFTWPSVKNAARRGHCSRAMAIEINNLYADIELKTLLGAQSGKYTGTQTKSSKHNGAQR